MTKLTYPIWVALVCLFTSQLQAQTPPPDFFDFRQNISIFTAHAIMNAAGFDGEWHKAGMHPLRIEVRKDLADRLDSSYLATLHSFFVAHDGGNWSNWASYVLLTNGPPTFELDYDTTTIPEDGNAAVRDMAELSPLLAEFYQKANIGQLWSQYEPRFQELNDEFRPHAASALQDISSYCRLEPGYFSKRASHIHVVFSPLMSYFTAQNDNVGNEIYLIFGPQVSEPSPAAFYHEALHTVIGPLTAQLDSTVTARFAPLFALATSGGHIAYAHIDEAFVRTLGCVLAGRLFHSPDSTVLEKVTDEYKLGFVLCLSIYEQLKQYEGSGMTFAQYFPTILANIDVEREKQRWQEFNPK